MGLPVVRQPGERMAESDRSSRGGLRRPEPPPGSDRFPPGALTVPITVTFDVTRPTSAELHRIRGFFERLGWERLGNTAYRYPKLHHPHPTEDWFNHVIPALMLLRAFARHALTSGRNIDK